MTRSEYITRYYKLSAAFRNSLRRLYYSQYVTAELRAFLLSSIPKKLIINSLSPDFTDIRNGNWTGLVGFIPSTIADMLQANGDWLSNHNGICILLETAQQIRERL